MKSAWKVLAVATALILGVVLVVTGFLEFRASRRLVEEGRFAVAKVIDDEITTGRRGQREHYLRIEFETDAGRTIQERVQVEKADYEAAKGSGQVGILYLPENPSVCQVGEEANTRYGILLAGCLILGTGVFLLMTFHRPLDEEETAEIKSGGIEKLSEPDQEYAPVNPREFSHLDMNFYNNAGNRLEAMGYRFLQDRESLTLRRARGTRVMIRALLGGEGTIIAGLYHLRPSFKERLLGVTESRVLELQTKLSDGTFVCTTNARAAGGLNYPGAVKTRFLPATTPLELILCAHTKYLAQAIAARPGVQPVSLQTIEECDQVQQELNLIKSEFRAKTGMTKAELRRMAATSDSNAIASVHDHILRLHNGDARRAV